MDKDLFNNNISRFDPAEEELKNYDTNSFNERVKRLKFINRIYPFGQREFGSDESEKIFDEALHAYIFGQYISTIILAQAFVERIDKIRLKRNPFVHYHAPFQKDTLMARSLNNKINPDELLQNDAKEAIEIMLEMVQRRIL